MYKNNKLRLNLILNNNINHKIFMLRGDLELKFILKKLDLTI